MYITCTEMLYNKQNEPVSCFELVSIWRCEVWMELRCRHTCGSLRCGIQNLDLIFTAALLLGCLYLKTRLEALASSALFYDEYGDLISDLIFRAQLERT